MRIPVIHGVIDRRMLVNYRADPSVVAKLLPAPFKPLVAQGYAMVGICLIRLKNIRPRFLPIPWGIGSENAAHRIAVHWESDGRPREGVFIPRRDTSSRLNAWAGGRLFPGEHQLAKFTVSEARNSFDVDMRSHDGKADLHVEATKASKLSAGSIFETLEAASDFFQRGSIGYSVTQKANHFDGLELHCQNWQVTPLAVSQVRSSYFEDPLRFPSGSLEFDCALLMRDVSHEWRGREEICCAVS